MPCAASEEVINLESLLDENKQIRREEFLNVMQFNEVNPNKFKRVLFQCIHVMEECGAWCANNVGLSLIFD